MFRRKLVWLPLCLAAAAASPAVAQHPDLTYHTVEPCTVVDTRSAGGTFAAGETRTYTVVGSGSLASQGGSSTGCEVPGFSNGIPQVQAVALNIVAFAPSGNGNLMAFAADTTTATSFLNFTTGESVANTGPVAVAQTSGVGDFKVTVNISGSHVIVRVVGYYSKAVQTVFVHPVPGDATASGTRLANALAGITNASSTKRYVVKVEPGIYDVGSTGLQMKAYVDIEGSGQEATVIKGTGGSDPDATGVILGAASSEVRDLKVVADGSATATVGIFLPSGANTGIRDVTIAASGTNTNWGIRSFSGMASSIEGVTITTSGGSIGYGIGLKYSSTAPTIKRTVIDVASGSSTRYGISALTGASLPEVRDVQIEVAGTSSTYGIYLDPYPYTGIEAHITGSSVEAEDAGIYFRGSQLVVKHSEIRATGSLGSGIDATSTVIVNHSELEGDGTTVIAGSATIGATLLDGGSAINATCAGVYDASYTFYASTCP